MTTPMAALTTEHLTLDLHAAATVPVARDQIGDDK